MPSTVPKQLSIPMAVNKTGWPWDVQPVYLAQKMANGLEWPRISITIPSFNQGKYLEETLRSIFLQGYPNLEVFVMDGGSTDESLQILEAYSPWLTAWKSEPDRGQSHAINKGWELSSGDLIAYMPSDDIYYPGAFQKVAENWNYAKDVVLIAGASTSIDCNSVKHKINHSRISKAAPLDLSILDIGEWHISQQASFFSKAHLYEVGFWLREDLHYVMDRELMYRLCRRGKIILLDDVLAGDRTHAAAKRQRDRMRMYREDGLAMNYCTWGNKKDQKRREKVAHSRLAQGYRMNAVNERNIFKKVLYYGCAVWCRPRYLLRFLPIKIMLPALRAVRNSFRHVGTGG